MTKFGLEQMESPPPLWWRRLERALIIVVAPAFSAFFTVIIEDERSEIIALASVTFVTAIIKGVGVFLGTDAPYPTEQE